MLWRDSPELPVHLLRILLGQLLHRAHTKQLKITQHRWAHRNQITKAPSFYRHNNLLDSQSEFH
jgi:hypothetical protein